MGLAVLTFISACKREKGCTDPSALNYSASARKDDGSCQYPLTLSITNRVAGMPLSTSAKYITCFGDTFTVSRLLYFISDLRLDHEGGTFAIDTIIFVNGLTTSSTVTINRALPVGTYHRLRFTFGIVNSNNYVHAINPPISEMIWPAMMTDGVDRYHYLRMEGMWRDPDSPHYKAYNMHTGPSHGMDFSVPVSIDLGRVSVAQGSKPTITITMDIAGLWCSPHDFDVDIYGVAIMGDTVAQRIIKENASDAFSATLK